MDQQTAQSTEISPPTSSTLVQSDTQPAPENSQPGLIATSPIPQSNLNTHIVGRRIAAALIDIIIWTILNIIASLLFGTTSVTNGTASANLTGIPAIIFILLLSLYYILMEAMLGGTIGKLVLKLKVVTLTGEKISLKQSFIRNTLRIVDGIPYIIPCVLGLAIIATNENKQRLGDKIAKTLVVKS